LIELLAEHSGGLSLTVIAETLRLPKSATHRLLTLLAERGYLVQIEKGRYRLTLRLTALGFRYLSGTNLSEVCQPVLDRLAAETGELARLAVVDQGALTWVAKAQGAKRGLRYDPDMGREVVLHATATGKAWLATLPIDEALALVTARGFSTPDRFGPKVIRTAAALRREIEATRERGYGVAEEEGEPGTAAIAAVIRRPPPDVAVVGTVSVAGPMARITAERYEGLARRVRAAAEELALLWPVRDLGGLREPEREEVLA
jgi:DNA-binding IclR family transcriptional regulator